MPYADDELERAIEIIWPIMSKAEAQGITAAGLGLAMLTTAVAFMVAAQGREFAWSALEAWALRARDGGFDPESSMIDHG